MAYNNYITKPIIDMLSLHTTVPFYNNLILGFDFASQTGNYRLADYSKYKMSGAINGSSTYESGLFRFNSAASSYITFPNTTNFNIGTEIFTFSCTFKSADTSTEFILLSTKDVGGTSGYYFSINTTSLNIYATSNITLPLGYNYLDTNFHTITITRVDNTVSGMRVYIDGVLIGTMTGATSYTSSTAIILGRMYGSTASNYTNGYIYNMFLWRGINISNADTINMSTLFNRIDFNNPYSRITEEIANIYSQPQSDNLYYIDTSIQFDILTKSTVSDITWNFNSEGSSTIKNPTFTFTVFGIKTISVTFTESSIIKTLTKTINILPKDYYVDTFVKFQLRAYTDESYSNKTITFNNGATLSTAQKKFGDYSFYFNGTSSYISTPNHTDFNFGAGIFSIEMWINFTSLSGVQCLFSQQSISNTYIGIRKNADNRIQFFATNATTSVGNYTTTNALSISINTWYHIALVKNGSTIYLFQDGISIPLTITTALTTMPFGTGEFRIGAEYDVSEYFNGYIDEVRISKDIARYTSNFTLPSAEFSYDYYTKLLLHANGDISNSPKNLTFNGNTTISPNEYIVGKNSFYFDGTGDYISIPDSEDFNLGSGDFTAECWLRRGSTGLSYFLGQIPSDGATVNSSLMLEFNASNFPKITISVGATTYAATSATAITSSSEWYHIAGVRNGNNLILYVNGLSVATTSITGVTINNSTSVFSIGAAGDYTGARFTGYINAVRISKGIARYTTNFTPSKDEYVSDSNTSLLLYAKADESRTYKNIIFNGNAGFSTVQKKFGNTSLYLDGTGDIVSLAATSDVTFNTGSFTVEGWFYETGASSWRTIASTRTAATADATAWGFTISNTLYPTWFSDVAVITSSTLISLNTWYHLAVVRNGTTTTMYLNGISVGSATDTRDYTKNILTIGGNNNSTELFLGYIDELRISKGIARYTSNFTPSTEPFIYDKYTSLLLHMEGDESGTKSFTTATGTPQINGTQKAYYFDGSSDAIVIPASSDFDFGTGDMTLDFYYYKAGTPETSARLFQTVSGDVIGGISFIHSAANTLAMYLSSNGSSFNMAAPMTTFSITDNTWHHIAFVRNGTSFTIYKDGISVSTLTSSAAISYNVAHTPVIGGNGSGVSRSINGYIDEFRISKGIARWTTNFTPPTRRNTL